jgi:hypothetical protein
MEVQLDEFICKCLCYNPGRSYLDIIGPNDTACIVSLIKNSKDMWDQDIKMKELGAQAISNQEKKLQPLLTSGSDQKRTQGKSLRNKEGMQYFCNAEIKWREIYDSEDNMKILYNGWETWMTATGSDIKIGDGSKKTFKTVMAMWCEDAPHNSNKEESYVDGESWGFEGGYSSSRGHSGHSLDWQNS